MVTATIESGSVEAKIGDAKRKARQLAVAAWTPQPVKQADGSYLDLCWRGRLHRAIKMYADTVNAGNDALAKKINAGIDKLNEAANAAGNAAEKAISEYSALVAANGGTPDDLYPPECQCAGCRESGRFHRMGSAEANARRAVWAFLGPESVGEAPAIIGLFERSRRDDDVGKGARDGVWRHLYAIATALEEYRQAAADCGETPDYGKVLDGMGR